MKTYMINVVGRYKYYNIFLTIFDQLNPEYSKYYKKVEAESLLSQAGFKNMNLSTDMDTAGLCLELKKKLNASPMLEDYYLLIQIHLF